MKRFTIIFTEKDDNVECKAVNEGFTGMELIGLLEIKKTDIIRQFTNPELFRRFVTDTDGVAKDIIQGAEDTE